LFCFYCKRRCAVASKENCANRIRLTRVLDDRAKHVFC
jgi:hypothetical protein